MKNDPEFVRNSNSSLGLITFQLSNVRELETIKYAFAYTKFSCIAKLMVMFDFVSEKFTLVMVAVYKKEFGNNHKLTIDAKRRIEKLQSDLSKP